MGSYSDYIENLFLDLFTGNTLSFSLPTLGKIWVALSTSDPLDDGSGISEPSGGGYARIETVGATNWNVAAGGIKTNKTILEFPMVLTTWGDIRYFYISDASIGGNMMGHGDLGTTYVTVPGTIIRFAIGQLVITQT